jgi:small-conductance mechanosensitive channel
MSSTTEAFFTVLRERGPVLAARFGTAAATLVVAWLASRLGARIARRALERVRAEAFTTFIPAAVRTSILVVGAIGALEQLGVDVSTLIAGASVLGLAVGIGSQAIVKDVVSGIFLVVDGALAPGDHVKIGECVGVVERVGLRLTEVRGERGELYYVANGSIGTVANQSREWARIAVEVPVRHTADLASSLASLQRIASRFGDEFATSVLEPPEALGIVALDAERATVRVVARVKSEARESAGLALRRRIRDEFYGDVRDA